MIVKNHKLPPELMQVIACPLTKAPLEYDDANNELISPSAGLAFPIHEGIPIMLLERARRF